MNTDLNFKDAIGFLKYYAEQFSFKPVLVYIPSRNEVTNNYRKYDQELCPACPDSLTEISNQTKIPIENIRSSCAALNVPFLELTEVLSRYESEGQRLYWNYDEHMNASGNRVVGKAVYDFFSSQVTRN